MLIDEERYAGSVLAWHRDEHGGWRGLVRYRGSHATGHLLTYECWFPAEVLEPRA